MKIDTNPELLFTKSKANPICCIYLITSPSGKKYVGQTINIYWRMYKYSRLHCDKQAKLYASFKKYGWDAHRVDIIEECTIDQLDLLEVRYISLYDTFNTDNGLNLISGGNRPKFSDETKQKLRIAATGKKYSDETNFKKGTSKRGKKLSDEIIQRMKIWLSNPSDETRKKRSDRFSGEGNPMFGKKWTDEQKKAHGDKITKLNIRLGKVKSVVQYTLEGEYIKEYMSQKEAAKSVRKDGGEGGNIIKCCDKKVQTAYGYKWEYKN